MKKIKLFLIAASIVAFISCSKNHTEIVDEEALLEQQSRDEGSQNDSTGGGVNFRVTPWIDNLIDTCIATEVPKEEVKTDTIPNDSIPSDSIPK